MNKKRKEALKGMEFCKPSENAFATGIGSFEKS